MRNKPIFLIWSLIFVLLAGSMKNALILNFYLIDNQDFVALFCENTDKPEIKCEGNCQLSKLANQQDKDNELPVLPFQLSNDLVFYAAEIKFDFQPANKQIKHNFFYSDKIGLAELSQPTPPPLFG